MADEVQVALVGVAGTLAGGLLSALVAIWTTKSTRARDAALEAQRFEQSESVRQRNERLAAYREWLEAVEEVVAAFSQGEDGQVALSQMARAAQLVELVGSPEVSAEIARTHEISSHLQKRLTDRPALLRDLQESHRSAGSMMRTEVS